MDGWPANPVPNQGGVGGIGGQASQKEGLQVVGQLTPPPIGVRGVIRAGLSGAACGGVGWPPRPRLGWERPVIGGASWGKGPKEVGQLTFYIYI